MNKAVPWNINGVGFDAREAAREAARRQGKSLGEWLDGVIADHAADLGVEEGDFGGQDRIDAVTSKLEHLSARRDERGGQRDADPRDRPARKDRLMTNHQGARGRDRFEDDFETDHDRPEATARFRRSDRERPVERLREDRRPMRSHAAMEDTELLLEEAIDAMERRALRVERKTDKALASFAKIIESSEHKRDDERDIFTALTHKLSDMETRITSRVADDSTKPIKGALARLEARLDTLSRRAAPEPAASPVAAVTPATDNEPIQRLESKLNAILDAMQTSSVAATAVAKAAYREPAPGAAPFANRRLGAAIADIAHHQRMLDGGAPRRPVEPAARLAPTPDQPAAGNVQAEIAALTAKIEEMRRDLSIRAPQPEVIDPNAAQMDALRTEVANISKIMRDIAPRNALPAQIAQMTAALEGIQRDIALRETARLRAEAQRVQTPTRSDLDGLKSDIAAMSKTLGYLAPREKVSALEEAIQTLTTRLEASRDVPANKAMLRPLEEIVGNLRHSMAEMDPRSPIGSLEREVRSIGSKLDDRNGIDASALGRIQDQTEEIRDLLSAAAAQPLAVERIEQQVATLAEKMERHPRLSGQDSLAFQTAADEIRGMLENPPGMALFDKIERRLEALTAKVEQAVDEASGARKVAESSRRHLDSVQEQLAFRLQAETPPPAADVTSLESLVRDLSKRIDAARAPDASGQAIEALQDQILLLSKRFERTDNELSTLSSIERSMHDLFAHLEETRASVETSAAKAARDAMAAAAASGGKADPVTIREIASLKAIQEAADHRTHDTLHAVHETLEKVVDRLSLMESDIARVRAAPGLPADDALRLDPRSAAPRAPKASSPRGAPDAKAALPDLMLDAADALHEPLVAPKMSERVRTPSFAPLHASSDLDENAGRADFIAAARRAARVAQSDPSVLAMKQPEPPAADDVRASLMAKTRDYVASHKKPVLLSIAALFVTLGTLAVMGSITTGDGPTQLAASTPVPPRAARMADAAPRRVEEAAPRHIEDTASSRRVEPAAPGAGRATLADLSPSTLPTAPPPVSDALPGSDPVTTGSINRLPSFAAQPAAAAPMPSGALKQLAEAGNAPAQYELASRYAEGRDLPKDFTQAATWYEKAAQQGLAPAQYKLASLYEKGLGVARDKAKARSWYIKAADAGNPRAMHNLAVLVADGDGKPDYASAVIWFRKAAEYGIHDSQYNLGILLARGLGAPQSLVQSYQWFAVAAQQNDTDAATKRDEVASKLTANDLAVAKALASAFHPKTANVAAVEIDPPTGGWDGVSSPAPVKSARPKLSSL